MTGLVRRVCTAVVALSATAVLTAGCGAEKITNAVAEASESAAAAATEAVEGGEVDIDVAVGDCVKLGGSMMDAEIEKADCGSMDSNYKVIGKAETNDKCIADADQTYYETFNGIEQGALCLDLDWVVGDCMDMGIGTSEPARIACTSTTAVEGIKVVEIIKDTASIDSCTSSQGFEYPDRRFVVCADELK